MLNRLFLNWLKYDKIPVAWLWSTFPRIAGCVQWATDHPFDCILCSIKSFTSGNLLTRRIISGLIPVSEKGLKSSLQEEMIDYTVSNLWEKPKGGHTSNLHSDNQAQFSEESWGWGKIDWTVVTGFVCGWGLIIWCRTLLNSLCRNGP